jgi:hypothetical protein
MPRRSSGPKLWFDKERESWTIVDGRSRHRTGCGPSEIKRAEAALRNYIEGKHQPAKSETPLIADVIAAYAEEHVKDLVSGKSISYDLEKLTKWWGTKRVTDINASTCRAYVVLSECIHSALEGEPLSDDAHAKNQAASEASAAPGFHDAGTGRAIPFEGSTCASLGAVFLDWLVYW